MPPNSVYPIFEGRIYTDTPITSTRLVLETADMWLPAYIGREQFKTSNILLTGADTRPRLEASIENTELTSAEKVEIVATLFNESGDPRRKTSSLGLTYGRTVGDHEKRVFGHAVAVERDRL